VSALLADAALTVAWIGFAGGVVAALLSVLVALRQAKADERLARLNSDLQAEVEARGKLLDRDLRAQDTLARYREPLAAAAFDLQSRLYNILALEFFATWGDGELADEAGRTTLFRIAQYFGWSEILRRNIQFLAFSADADTRKVAGLQARITEAFLTDAHDTAMILWKDHQRAIGERMIVDAAGEAQCMGYAEFRDRCDEVFDPWSARVRAEVRTERAQPRLRELQHALCDLVETLDDRRVRYTMGLERA
jgi:hypothetical protein